MVPLSPRPLQIKSPSPSASPDTNSPSPKTTNSPLPRTGNAISKPASGKLSISKNYVVPPRPKPGRKPNSESGTSKRKVQNRESQRMFRERKARAVEDLERQMAAQMAHYEQQQQALQHQIDLLAQHNMSLQQQRQQQQLPHQQVQVQPQIQFPELPHISFNHDPMIPPSPMFFSMSPPPSISSADHLSPSPASNSPGSPYITPLSPADAVGLELLDHVLEQKLPVKQDQSSTPPGSAANSGSPGSTGSSTRPPRKSISKSGGSPASPGPMVLRTDPPPVKNTLELVNSKWSQPAVPLKRYKQPLEIDFTTKFTPNTPKSISVHSPPPLKDRCGFCTDNTVCICAESAARESGSMINDDFYSPLSPATNSAPVTSVGSPLAAEVKPETKDDCTGNPLSCIQCKEDPLLTLFCSAVANKTNCVPAPPTGTFIPTLAAYKTLTRHPGFYSANLSETVNVLVTRGSQVEVNSVAKVLRLLDTKQL